jgi:hypothetical protein
MCLKQREIRTLRNTTTNRKSKSKKTMQLKVIDINTYAVWCEEMANKSKKRRIRSKLRKGSLNRKSGSNQRKKIISEKEFVRYQRMIEIITN